MVTANYNNLLLSLFKKSMINVKETLFIKTKNKLINT